MITSIHGILAVNRFSDPTSNIFLGTVSNLWSNPANWSYGHVPNNTERARIHNGCVLDSHGICDELYIDSGYTLGASGTAWVLTLNSIKNYGTWNCINTFNFVGNDTRNTIWGNINFLNSGTAAFSNTTGTLTVPSLDYYNIASGLNYVGSATKQINTPVTARGTYTMYIGSFVVNAEFTVMGTGTNVLGGSGKTYINNSTFTFNGTLNCAISNAITFTNSTVYANGLMSLQGYSYGGYFSGNNTIYFKNGFDMKGGNMTNSDANGTDFIFRTNNQSINMSAALSIKSMTIEGNITVTQSGINYLYTAQTINGTTSNSKLLNKGTISYGGSTIPMSTGILDCSAYVNTFNYTSVSDLNLKSVDYWNLNISGAGIKTLLDDVTISGNLNITGIYASGATGNNLANNVVLDLSDKNFVVNGTTIINLASGIRKSSSTGITLFVGSVSTSSELAWFSFTNNAILEFRNGASFGFNRSTLFDVQNSTFKFTTNNQTYISGSYTGNDHYPSPNILIDNIVLTLSSTTNATTFIYSSNWINGTTPASTLKNINNTSTSLGHFGLTYMGVLLMTTGQLDNSISNKINYARSGNQNIKEGNYSNLYLSGTATPNQKILQGDVSVLGTYTVSGNAVKDNNGFVFTAP